MKTDIFKTAGMLIIISLLYGCEKEYVPPTNSDFSDAVVTSSPNKSIQVGDFTSFADLSKGVVSRTWSIPESATIINLDGRNASDLALIHVRFDKPGVFEVNLKCAFRESTLKLDTTFVVTVRDL